MSLSSQPARTDCITRFPAELSSIVFNDLSLADIVRASHVSRQWRTRAHAHPTFYGDIVFTCRIDRSPSQAEGDFFHARILAGSTKTIGSLRIHVAQRCRAIEVLVIPAVHFCLPRLKRLTITVDVVYGLLLLRALAGPAPNLERLFVQLNDPSRTADTVTSRFGVTIPVDIFAGYAPKLSRIGLSTMTWPAVPIPAFRFVTRVLLDPGEGVVTRSAIPRPADIFTVCPNLSKLTLAWDCYEREDEGAETFWDSYKGRKLEKLIIQGDMQTGAVRALTGAETKKVVISSRCANADVYKHIFSHFPGDIRMRLSTTHLPDYDITAEELGVALSDDYRIRKVSYPITEDIEDLLRPEFYASIIPRITALSVDVPNWDDLPSLSLFFPNVETLIIGAHPHAEPLDGGAQVTCPALKRLEIQGPEWDQECQRDVSVERLAEYMVNQLGWVPRRNLSLTLRRVFLLGDHGVIQGFFKEITIV